MEHERFNKLLSEMPGISKVVNAFTSEAVQRGAFRVLVNALGADALEDAGDETGDAGEVVKVRKSKAGTKKQSRTGEPAEKTGQAEGSFDAQAFANKLKDRPHFKRISEMILHKRDLRNKIRLILLSTDAQLTSGDINKVLACLDLKTDKGSVSNKLKDMGPSLVSTGVRRRGARIWYKFSAPGRSDAKKWLDETLK